MAKPYGSEITRCPSCRKAIGDKHPYTWCMECGEPFPNEVRALFPNMPQVPPAKEEAPPHMTPRELGKKKMLTGGGWFLLGAVVTLATYSLVAEHGGPYVLLWGAIVYGLTRFLAGLIQFLFDYRQIGDPRAE